MDTQTTGILHRNGVKATDAYDPMEFCHRLGLVELLKRVKVPCYHWNKTVETLVLQNEEDVNASRGHITVCHEPTAEGFAVYVTAFGTATGRRTVRHPETRQARTVLEVRDAFAAFYGERDALIARYLSD